MDDFSVEIRESRDRTAVLEVRGALTPWGRGALDAALQSVREGAFPEGILDLSGFRGLDGGGLFEFAEFLVRLFPESRFLNAFGQPPALRGLLKKLGFSSRLRLYASESAALQAAENGGEEDGPGSWGDGGAPLLDGWLDPSAPGPTLVGPFEGFGDLWHKVYRLCLRGTAATAEEASRLLRERLEDFWPPDDRLAFPPGGPLPGAVGKIVLHLAGGVPLHTAAQVLHADRRSFTLGAVSGHVEAGWIHFGIEEDGDSAVIQVQSLGRGSDPLFEAGLRLFGHAEQERFWRGTLERIAAHFGARQPVEWWLQRIDDRVRWQAASNLLYSAALREPLALVGEALGSGAGSGGEAALSKASAGATRQRRVVILGGGYGGLACLRELSKRLSPSRYKFRLIDATPYHTIKTRFHERAVVESREGLLRLPLSTLVAASRGEFIHDEIQSVDLEGGCVTGLRDAYPYDRLVLALGGRIAYFGVEGAAEHTVSLQTYEQAAECSRRVAALRGAGERTRIVVVGAGIEGLEVAAMLRQEISAERCEIVVVDRGGKLMAQSQCGDSQRGYVMRWLERRGIDLRLNTGIRLVGDGFVILDGGSRLRSDLTVWCSGVVPAVVSGIPESFRVGVDLRSMDHPGVFAVGDFATVESSQVAANLRSAQRAAYQGELAATNLCRLEEGRPLAAAHYRPIGELIALGDYDGVGVAFGAGLTGVRAAFLKKAHEAKYLADVLHDVPGAVGRGLLSVARKGLLDQ